MNPKDITKLVHKRFDVHDIDDDNIIVVPPKPDERKVQIVDQDDRSVHKAWVTWHIGGSNIHFVVDLDQGGYKDFVIPRRKTEEELSPIIDAEIDKMTAFIDIDYSD